MQTKTINEAWDRPCFSEVSVAATLASTARDLGYTATIGAIPDPDNPGLIVDLIITDGDHAQAIEVVNPMNATYLDHIRDSLALLGIPCACLSTKALPAFGVCFEYGFDTETNELLIAHRDGASTSDVLLRHLFGYNQVPTP